MQLDRMAIRLRQTIIKCGCGIAPQLPCGRCEADIYDVLAEVRNFALQMSNVNIETIIDDTKENYVTDNKIDGHDDLKDGLQEMAETLVTLNDDLKV